MFYIILALNNSGINLKYCYHFTYNNWHLFSLHICFHLLHIYAPRATIIDTITFHLIYYMTTFQKLYFFAKVFFGRAPKYEIRNLLVNTFHLIYYMTTFKNFIFFALDGLPATPRKGPTIWNPKPTRQDLSLDILHDYLSKTLICCTWWPHPTPSEGPQHMKSTSRHASFSRTSLRWRHTSGHMTVTLLHLPVRKVLLP